jgi:serine/threonine protein kinase
MQLVRGVSLAQLPSDVPLSARNTAAIIHQISQALVVAHAHGVVHGHLKPTKILLDRRGQARLCGLGLAYRVPGGSELTTTGDAFEAPHYMPPELASGQTQRPTPLSDVYSLGAVLYFLLAGRAPFQAANLLDVMQRIVDQPPAPPSEITPSVDPWLEAICLRCLQKDPQRRYPSVQALANDLHDYLHRRRTLLRPRGVLSRLARWWQWTRRLA